MARRYSYAQLEGLWIDAGGDPARAPLMAAIAMAESRGNPQAKNPSGASGLWQILGLPFPGNPFDPGTNARMAVAKYQQQGLGAWTTYKSGEYRLFYRQGVTPQHGSKATLTGFNPIGAGASTALGQLGLGGAAGAAGDVAAAGHILNDIGSATWWRRIGKGAIGGALVISGVYFVMAKEGYHPVKETVNVGKKAVKVAAK